MAHFESLRALDPTENKKILDGTVYFAYFHGKKVDRQGFLSKSGAGFTTRKEAVSALRKAKKRAMWTYWGRLDYIVKFSDTKTIIHPEKF